jgi:hypothetical protein
MKPPLRIDASQREDDDIALYRRLVRDICFLYHELADYRHIMGDLDYSTDYTLDYWLLLNRIDTGRPDDRFIRGGILILLLAMLQDVFDGSGNAITENIERAKLAIAEFVPEDEDMLRLMEAAEHGLKLLETTGSADDQFDTDASWAYGAFVRAYFAAHGT